MDRCFPDLSLPCVASDNRAGAAKAVSCLLGQGHRRIACIQGLPGTTPNEDRVRGYRDAHREHGVPVDEGLVVGRGFHEENGYRETLRLLRTRRDVTAIWALNSLILLGAYRALREKAVRVPDEMSLVCFDDPHYAPHLACPPTAVAQRHAEMAQAAVRLLFDRLPGAAGRRRPERVLIPARVGEAVACDGSLHQATVSEVVGEGNEVAIAAAENRANGWSYEAGYWDEIAVEHR